MVRMSQNADPILIYGDAGDKIQSLTQGDFNGDLDNDLVIGGRCGGSSTLAYSLIFYSPAPSPLDSSGNPIAYRPADADAKIKGCRITSTADHNDDGYSDIWVKYQGSFWLYDGAPN